MMPVNTLEATAVLSNPIKIEEVNSAKLVIIEYGMAEYIFALLKRYLIGRRKKIYTPYIIGNDTYQSFINNFISNERESNSNQFISCWSPMRESMVFVTIK